MKARRSKGRRASDARYRASPAAKASRARFINAERRRNAHLCARPGCGKIVVKKRRGRRAQLCKSCCVAIRMSIRFGDEDGRTLPGLGVVE